MISSIDTINITDTSIDKIMQKVDSYKKRLNGGIDDNELRKLEENEQGLKKVANAFESIFVNMLFKEMRKTVDDSQGIMASSSEQKLYQEMLDSEISKELSKDRSFGIANAIERMYSTNLVNKKIGETYGSSNKLFI